MLRKLYDWVLSLAAHRHAVAALALISFLESSVFPIPPDVMLVPMILAQRSHAFRLSALCTLASVLGGCVGYGIGFFLWETIGQWIVHAYGLADKMAAFQSAFQEYGWWIILLKGMTPIPYKLVTIASGVANFDFMSFIWASFLSRALRFFLLGALLWFFGEPIRRFIERYLTLVTTVFVIFLVGGFAALRFL